MGILIEREAPEEGDSQCKRKAERALKVLDSINVESRELYSSSQTTKPEWTCRTNQLTGHFLL